MNSTRKLILAAILVAAAPVADAATTIFVETPSARYTLLWCVISDIHVLRHGTTADGSADCKQSVSQPQTPGWTPEPHPDGLIPLWEASFHLSPVGAFAGCELIEYRRSFSDESLVIQCLSDPVPQALR